MTRTIRVLLMFLALFPTAFYADAAEISKLKDLCLNTTIVEGGKHQAVIISPVSGRYDDSSHSIRRTIKEEAGVAVPCDASWRVAAKGRC